MYNLISSNKGGDKIMDSDDMKMEFLILKKQMELVRSVDIEKIQLKLDNDSMRLLQDKGIMVNKRTIEILMEYTNYAVSKACIEVKSQLLSELEASLANLDQ